MKRRPALPLLLLLIAAILAGCEEGATAYGSFLAHTYGVEPSPAPSQQVYTARPEELTIGSHPFSALTPQNVRSIRITIFRDSQPPDWPDPHKLLDTEELLTMAVSYLQGIRITETEKENPQAVRTAIPGQSRLSMLLTLTDGTSQEYHFGGMHMSNGHYYAFSAAADMETLYESLPIAEWYELAGNVLTTSSSLDSDGVFVRRSADIGAPSGELVARRDGEESVLYSWVCLSPWIFGKANGRVVFAGYSGDGAEDRKTVRIYSIGTDGDDIKELDVRGHVAGDPLWYDGMLYYVGASSDGSYPRPLNRVNADFSRHIKLMDLPGPLVCISSNGGHVYCLSADRKSVLRMPGENVAMTFEHPIVRFARLQAYSGELSFTDDTGVETRWSSGEVDTSANP